MRSRWGFRTFDDWKKACRRLNKYQKKVESLKKIETALSRREFENAVKRLIETKKCFLENKRNSLNGKIPHFSKDRGKILFVEKMIVKPGAEISMHADIHGDIHSTIAYLNDLKKKGKINNNWNIAHNFYIVFLGDYTDRGCFAAEVIYTIARLKIANPDQVIFLRGNHEALNLDKSC